MDDEPEEPFIEEDPEEENEELLEKLEEDLPAARYGLPHNPLIPSSLRINPTPIRTTFPYLSRYEVATLIGRRAEMIEQGAPPSPYITISDEYKTDQNYAIRIALRELSATYELKKNIIPLKILRNLGDGTIEEWSLVDEKTGKVLLSLKDEALNEQMF